MISDNNLKLFIEQWTMTSGLTILRADQMVKMPPYPYATYKEIASNVESWVSNIKTMSYNPTNKEVTIKEHETSETTISVNVFSNRHDDCKIKADLLRLGLKTEIVNKKAADLNMSIILGLTNIQDRTIFLESNYEYRFGFDFILRSVTSVEEIIKSIESVSGQIETVNGIITTNKNYEVNG